MKSNKKSIAFWGVEAPPYGGMSIHLKRLTQYLHQKNWKVIQFNFTTYQRKENYIKNIRNKIFWYLNLWFDKSSKIHYVITTRSHIRFLAAILTLRGKIIIIRVGGKSMENQLAKGGLSKFLNIASIKLSSAFIGVSNEICELAKKYTSKNKIHHIPGFIVPIKEEFNLSEELKSFFHHSTTKIVITGRIFPPDHFDIYGLYHTIDAFEILLDKNIDFKAIYVIPKYNDVKSDENIIHFKNEITRKGLNEHVLVHINEDELWPIFQISDIFIRSSLTDGDANSIREALFFKNHVIASDCVKRPESCKIYRTNDPNDLARQIEDVITFSNNDMAIPEEKDCVNQITLEQLFSQLIF